MFAIEMGFEKVRKGCNLVVIELEGSSELNYPTLLQGFSVTFGLKIDKIQWLISSECDSLVDNGPKLAVMQPNSWYKNFQELKIFVV